MQRGKKKRQAKPRSSTKRVQSEPVLQLQPTLVHLTSDPMTGDTKMVLLDESRYVTVNQKILHEVYEAVEMPGLAWHWFQTCFEPVLILGEIDDDYDPITHSDTTVHEAGSKSSSRSSNSLSSSVLGPSPSSQSSLSQPLIISHRQDGHNFSHKTARGGRRLQLLRMNGQTQIKCEHCFR